MYRNCAYIQNKQVMRLFTWDEHGNRIQYDSSYEPYFYQETANHPDATSIFNTPLRKRTFRTGHDRYKYLQENDIVRIFENLPYTQQFLVDTFAGQNETLEFSKFPLRLYYLDIETYSVGAFPVPDIAADTVNIITIYDTLNKTFTSWGLGEASPKLPNHKYIKCCSERDMFTQFITFFKQNPPDILSGWNIEFFDVPYIINRIRNLFDDEMVKSLSPVDRVYSRQIKADYGKEKTRWYIDGISCIDYLDIYKRFCPVERESYKLGSIGEIELKETKVDYGEQNLSSLADSDWELFVDYNVQDVNLIVKLEEKLRYLELLRMLAYAGCTTFESALGTVSVVTGLCAVKARQRNQKIPTFNKENIDSKYEGAYVGEPKKGFQNNVVSFDANSLYPNTMITLNLSPETKVGRVYRDNPNVVTIKHVSGQSYDLTPENFKKFIEKEKIAVSKADVLFSQKNTGIVPDIVDSYYKRRVEIKKILKKLQLEASKIDREIKDLTAQLEK